MQWRRTSVEHVMGMPWRETTNSTWNTTTPPLAALRPGCGWKNGTLCVIPMEILAVPTVGNHHGEKLTVSSARAVLVTRRGDRARRVPERAQRSPTHHPWARGGGGRASNRLRARRGGRAQQTHELLPLPFSLRSLVPLSSLDLGGRVGGGGGNSEAQPRASSMRSLQRRDELTLWGN
jgi:hypothetical protein